MRLTKADNGQLNQADSLWLKERLGAVIGSYTMSNDALLANRKSKRSPKSSQLLVCCFLVALVVHFRGWAPLFACHETTGLDDLNDLQRRQLRAAGSGPKITAIVSSSDSPNARKLKQDLLLSNLVETVQELNADSTSLPAFALPYCSKAQSRYKDLHATYPHLALELVKYCALAQDDGGLVIDGDSPMVTSLEDLLNEGLPYSVGVLNDEYAYQAIHGAFLYLKDGYIAKQMVNFLSNVAFEELRASPILLTPKRLYTLIAEDAKVSVLTPGVMGNNWVLFQHRCIFHYQPGNPGQASLFRHNISNSYSLSQNCPESMGFCCSILEPETQATMMLTKHLVLPHLMPSNQRNGPKPLQAQAGHYNEADLPYISTITEQILERLAEPKATPNFFDIMSQKNCLPDEKRCLDCLKNRMGGNCQTCKSFCQCYCKALCHTPIPEKFVAKNLTILPPQHARDPSRLIPKIIHQTWFEDVTPEEYPNLSRLIESFKQSGWTYVFYTDRDIENFLSTHFPPEVRQAYDALRPGSFKADLFRYCVLLIYGGVYADIDVILETNLDLAIDPDIGFMVPEDEPVDSVGKHKMCLWNGFIASAPGHPFMAKVIESAVNNARNRFTIVDIDAMFCPKPQLSIMREVDTLFTTGPCLLGATINKVIGRHGQASFDAGEIDLLELRNEKLLRKKQTGGVAVQDEPNQKIPGRTIILQQGKRDMGAHRFSFLEKNLVVAATDLPGSDDRGGQNKPQGHYSNTHVVEVGIYGLDKLYTDDMKANEELRFYIER